MKENSLYTKKLFTEKYLITSPFYNISEKKIVVIGDIHHHKNVPLEIYKTLLLKLQSINPDFILIPGDIIETFDFLEIPTERKKLEALIQAMAEISKVIISLGNHDIDTIPSNINRNQANIIKTKANNSKLINYFESLNRFKNVYVLNNQQTLIEGINFSGFTPPISTYLSIGDKKTSETFIESYLKNDFKIDKNNYNILLTHSPILLYDNEVKETLSDLENTDFIVTGHLHDGYLPKKLDLFFAHTNVGLFITPFVKPIPGLVCRGMHEYGRGFLFVTQGFRKYTDDNFLFNFFERITANDIEEIELTHNDKKIYIKK